MNNVLPIFSTSLGMTKITNSMKPIIKPIGLFKNDIIEKGSLNCKTMMGTLV